MQNFENQNTLIQWVNKLNIYIYIYISLGQKQHTCTTWVETYW